MAGTTRRAFGRLRKLPSGKYQAAYIGPDGRLYTADQTYATKGSAEGWLAQRQREIDLGTWGTAAASTVTLRAYAEQWLAGRKLGERTRDNYASMLERLILPDLGDRKLRSIKPVEITEWHRGLGTKHPTRNAHAYSLLHAIMATAVREEYLDANPCRISGASTTRRQHTVVTLEPDQVAKLAVELDSRKDGWGLAALVMVWGGLRWGEVSELRAGDVSGNGKQVSVTRAVSYRKGKFVVGPPKTDAGVRTVALPKHVATALAEWTKGLGADELLFTRPDGGYVGHFHFHYPFKASAKAVGVPTVRVHDLRHSGAVLAARAGATTAELMRRIGHSTPAAALRYQHASDQRDAEIAKRLDKLR